MADDMGHVGTGVPVVRIAALMACHNRVVSTTQSVRSLKSQTVPGVSVDLFLVDDGSRDGTSQAVRDLFPQAIILAGDGNLFWCGGVRWAFEEAINKNYDFYFWLNDDTILEQGALARLLDTYRVVSRDACGATIVAGSTRDPKTGRFTYGGWSQYRKPTGVISWKKTPPHMETPLACATMNGNIVLIAKSVVERIGNLDVAFVHTMGDLDYGLRAIKSGCRVYIAPGYHGTCASNDQPGWKAGSQAPLSLRWKQLLGPKGFPIKAWRVFTYRHKGPLWFLAWLEPYILFWLKSILFPKKGQ
jgi:GT2 family glycosyltransferase